MPEPDSPIPLPVLELCTHSGPQQQQSKWSLTVSTSPSSVLSGLLPTVFHGQCYICYIKYHSDRGYSITVMILTVEGNRKVSGF